MNPQTSHETEADKILKGCDEFRIPYHCGRKEGYKGQENFIWYCPSCKSFAKGLLTAYKNELEFLLQADKWIIEEDMDYLPIKERIQHLESEIKKLEGVVK